MAGNDYVNLFYLTYDAINAIKKKDLVDYIKKMKGKVVADNQIQNLCSEIVNLSDNVKSLVRTSERLTSELIVIKNVNNMLENRIVNLEKQLSKNEQHGHRNNIEISGISNQIPDQDLEENIIKICKDLDIDMDIEVCHRLLLGRNTTSTTKRVIAKFANRKHSEVMFQRKKDINAKNKVFATHSLCPYYRFLWGKCKDLQRKGRISQVFCLGAVVTIRVTEDSAAIKILRKRPDGIPGISPGFCVKYLTDHALIRLALLKILEKT